MVEHDLTWDDEHPTLQQIPKPTGWETQIEERPLDEDLIATVKAQRIDVRYELAQTKQRLKLMSLVAALAVAVCLALVLTLWIRPSSTANSQEADAPEVSSPAVVAPAPVTEPDAPEPAGETAPAVG